MVAIAARALDMGETDVAQRKRAFFVVSGIKQITAIPHAAGIEPQMAFEALELFGARLDIERCQCNAGCRGNATACFDKHLFFGVCPIKPWRRAAVVAGNVLREKTLTCRQNIAWNRIGITLSHDQISTLARFVGQLDLRPAAVEEKR